MTKKDAEALNRVSAEMFHIAASKGFHSRHKPGAADTNIDNIGAWLANLHSEVSELWESVRRGQLHDPCDKPVAMTCAEEELADIVIRAFDTAYAIGVDIGTAVLKKADYNKKRIHRHGGKRA